MHIRIRYRLMVYKDQNSFLIGYYNGPESAKMAAKSFVTGGFEYDIRKVTTEITQPLIEPYLNNIWDGKHYDDLADVITACLD